MDPEAGPTPEAAATAEAGVGAPGFELPTARQVVGRGLQLAFDHAAELRRTSLYIGLLVLATVGPAAVLLIVDLPALSAFPWSDPGSLTRSEAEAFVRLVWPLYVAGALALLGVVAVLVDGVLTAVALLGSRAARRPLSLRESLQRARQVFWRYGFAAFVVGVIATIASAIIGLATGALGHPESIGSNLLGSLVGTAITAPFGYVLTAIVIGDVDGAAALGRSVALARARPRLAVVVAAFAFLSSTLQTLGIGIAFDVADQVATFLHLNLDLAGSGLLLLVPVVAVALVAFGSLALTVSAIAAAPQIAAFLGLTHYSAGLEQARTTTFRPAAERDAPADGAVPAGPDASTGGSASPPAAAGTVASTFWQQPVPSVPGQARWMTRPMVGLVVLEVLVAVAGIAAPR